MSRRPSMYTRHLAARLSSDAQIALPRLATRAAMPFVPKRIAAPLARRDFAALTNAGRMEHVERWAMEQIVALGTERASALVIDLTSEVDRRRAVT